MVSGPAGGLTEHLPVEPLVAGGDEAGSPSGCPECLLAIFGGGLGRGRILFDGVADLGRRSHLVAEALASAEYPAGASRQPVEHLGGQDRCAPRSAVAPQFKIPDGMGAWKWFPRAVEAIEGSERAKITGKLLSCRRSCRVSICWCFGPFDWPHRRAVGRRFMPELSPILPTSRSSVCPRPAQNWCRFPPSPLVWPAHLSHDQARRAPGLDRGVL